MARLRKLIRALRLFYSPHSRELYRQCLSNYSKALFFPFGGQGRFLFKDGTLLQIPRQHWGMLATSCRAKKVGANIIWHENEMELEFKRRRFFAPPDSKLIPSALQGIFVDNIWRTAQTDLQGKKVLDVGAHVGIFTVACALKGALVHAVEPFPIFQKYIRKNVMENGLEGRVVIHGVGLSDGYQKINEPARLEEIASSSHGGGNKDGVEILFVDAVDYLEKQAIGKIHFLKLNCEGCEYSLLKDRLIEYLQPEFISLQYHRGGGEQIYRFLRKKGYLVEPGIESLKQTGEKGNIFAKLPQ